MSGPDSEAPADGGRDEAEVGPGVLGNLPRSRPAVRSPRRAGATPASGESGAGEPPRGKGEQAPGGREAEVEALARAGISLAGSAATLGLRVAGRAAAALRDAVERR